MEKWGIAIGSIACILIAIGPTTGSPIAMTISGLFYGAVGIFLYRKGKKKRENAR